LLTGIREFAGAIFEGSVHVAVSDDFSAVLQTFSEQLIVQTLTLAKSRHMVVDCRWKIGSAAVAFPESDDRRLLLVITRAENICTLYDVQTRQMLGKA
jgi:hypothetical protein